MLDRPGLDFRGVVVNCDLPMLNYDLPMFSMIYNVLTSAEQRKSR